MNFKIFFAWYDIWIGFYYDIKNKTLYFCLIPMIVIKINKISKRCKVCGRRK